ncbi:tail fiber assembly protein [Enterobacter kobei]|uniref:tail fiber assembly protein n=1 Tax=Enterobacter kobei TaxID=208224 RepID=UPI000DCC6FB8|nr:tail fiber assembly protein [Enterobacter kobei]ELE9752047.1 tail fiber assembly protein [Enterobacter kobei]RAY27712.1 phage tail protein [Enterobacter kobei]RAY45861.1 phage tail protein [Enterobacter kobei]
MQNYALIKNGVVENVVIWDENGNIFDDYTVVNLEGLTAGIGWTYDGEKFSAPPEPEPTHDELVQKAEILKQALISDANNYIDSNQWPSKLALGRLSDADKQLFNEWLDYLDALESVDPSKAPEIVWPVSPE